MGKSESRKVSLKIPSEIKIGISVTGQKNQIFVFYHSGV